MSNKKQPKQAAIDETVMKKISSGEVKMKSKAHFVLLNAILIASASLSAILAAIFVSQSIRDVQIGRNLRLHEFGGRGQQEFITSLPWMMLFFGVIAVWATVLLAKHFKFSYRHKTTAIMATVLITIFGVASFTTVTGINDKLADTRPLRPLNTFKKLADEKRIIGKITELSGEHLKVETAEGQVISIDISSKTRIDENGELKVGDDIVLFGSFRKGRFEAYGIRKGTPRVKASTIHRRQQF